MNAPDDFGYTPVRTFAHVARAERPRGFQRFWSAFRDRLLESSPELRFREPKELDQTDPGCDWGVQSESVNIGCHVIEPPKHAGVRAVLVVGHGYGTPEPVLAEAPRWRPLAQKGVRVVLMRVRGFPGSMTEHGSWNDASIPWITRGLDAYLTPASDGEHAPKPDPALWSLAQAVTDTANVLRAAFAFGVPVYAQGISFSGGLVTLAASQLEQLDRPLRLERLVLGVPSFGDWCWRLQSQRHMGRGSGGELHEYLLRNRAREDELHELFQLFDAATHAAAIHTPCVARLADLDEVVPAPTAAAVFNALGSGPAQRWRFRTTYGHFDGGLAHARRYKLFESMVNDALDPARPLYEAMHSWEPVLTGGTRPPEGFGDSSITGAQEALFEGGAGWDSTADAELVEAYAKLGRTLDDLPYTSEFEHLLVEIRAGERGARPGDVLRRLQNLRKAGKLPRLGKAQGKPVAVEGTEQDLLVELIERACGSVGQRDGLPYTADFERLVEDFNAGTGRGLDPHSVWRLIARLAK